MLDPYYLTTTRFVRRRAPNACRLGTETRRRKCGRRIGRDIQVGAAEDDVDRRTGTGMRVAAQPCLKGFKKEDDRNYPVGLLSPNGIIILRTQHTFTPWGNEATDIRR